jgi:hypothetical protein
VTAEASRESKLAFTTECSNNRLLYEGNNGNGGHNTLVVAWVLWKFEGNTIVLCNQAANWVSNSFSNVTAKTVRDLAGCGDGFYTVQT